MSTANMETRNAGGIPVVHVQEGTADAPSGFILKLYQMVNGAPDEVISVSPLYPWFSNLFRTPQKPFSSCWSRIEVQIGCMMFL